MDLLAPSFEGFVRGSRSSLRFPEFPPSPGGGRSERRLSLPRSGLVAEEVCWFEAPTCT